MTNKNTDSEQVILDWQSAGIEVDFQQSSLALNGHDTQLEPKVMDLLQLLIAQPNQLVSKEAIIDTLWRDRCVNEEGLTKVVSKLR